jgi:hypothetical protein
MHSHFILQQILKSVAIDTLQDMQSMNVSYGGTMSDACISESKKLLSKFFLGSEMPYLINRGHNHHMPNVEKLIEATVPIIRGRTRFFIVKSFDYDSI